MYSKKNELKKKERKSIVRGIKDQDPKVVISMLWWNATSLERCPDLCTSRFYMSQARPRTITFHGWHGSLRPRQGVCQPRDRWTLSLSSISEFWQSIQHRTENILEGRWLTLDIKKYSAFFGLWRHSLTEPPFTEYFHCPWCTSVQH